MLFLKWLLIILAVLFLAVYLINARISATTPVTSSSSEHFQQGKYHNPVPQPSLGFQKTLELWLRFFFEKKVNTVPNREIPVQALTSEQLKALTKQDIQITKLGHSTVLLKVMDEFWLLDPVFGERASPFSFMGPKRFHQPPISLEALPPIDRVLISHNHYDHLDKASIKQLAAKTKNFYVPLGVEADLEAWGIEKSKITSFDWWDETRTSNSLVAFTPTQHFSGRGLADGNQTLWGSWVIQAGDSRIYFSGDSGYFSGFKEIGQKYGPFDLTLIETGAYDKDWAHIHMTPEQSVQAHLDLQGKTMVPIHNGTFDLAFHSWTDPFERVKAAAKEASVDLSTPEFGEVFSSKGPAIKTDWWHDLQGQG